MRHKTLLLNNIGRVWRFLADPATGVTPKLVALAAVTYLLWPLDLIPLVPAVSWLDDAVVVGAAWGILNHLMQGYEARQAQGARQEYDVDL